MEAGFLLIGLTALFSTASAINATLFGTARLGMVMARDHALPGVFCFRSQKNNIPWVSLIAITALTLIFVNLAILTRKPALDRACLPVDSGNRITV